MEHYPSTPKSVGHTHVPKAISNAALTAIVAMCYVMLVAPTLELVSQANLSAQLLRNGFQGDQYVLTTTPSAARALKLQADQIISTKQVDDFDRKVVLKDYTEALVSEDNSVKNADLVGTNPSALTARSEELQLSKNSITTDSTTVETLKSAATAEQNAVNLTNPGNPSANGTLTSPDLMVPAKPDATAEARAEFTKEFTEKKARMAALNDAITTFANTEFKGLTADQFSRMLKQVQDATSELNTLMEEVSGMMNEFENQYYISTPAPGGTPRTINPGTGDFPGTIPVTVPGSNSSAPSNLVLPPTTTPAPTPPKGGGTPGNPDGPSNPNGEELKPSANDMLNL